MQQQIPWQRKIVGFAIPNVHRRTPMPHAAIPSEYALQAPQRGRNSSASSLEPAAQGFGKWQREQSPECGAKNFLNYTRERIVSSAKSGEIVESKTL
ncbi:hypothetical protein CABS02_15294 [Colletotrichum abscissum]|uniref:Uncharacterized protein n=1 Tax=Colletotrichum abscissum TaxID=1671311 RepID=A0A9P9WZN8_9PEZI|nr:hypothetical protein CABS02_15294 [Colletotrichum abscissum]